MNAYIAKIHHVLTSLSSLLADRGYNTHPCKEYSIDTILEKCLEQKVSIGSLLSCYVSRKSGSDLYISWLDPSFDLTKGREIMTSSYQIHGAMDKIKEGQNCILITYSKLSPDALKEVASLGSRIQVLHFNQLAINLSNHILVPPHIALSPKEALEFENSRGIKRKLLPQIKRTDPMRIWYNWPKDTIIRINRSQGVVWRVVV
jgi:DNA-directed RNA polymerases I, II, and III subunit RPABC1